MLDHNHIYHATVTDIYYLTRHYRFTANALLGEFAISIGGASRFTKADKLLSRVRFKRFGSGGVRPTYLRSQFRIATVARVIDDQGKILVREVWAQFKMKTRQISYYFYFFK